jgi:lipopolysaccharide/colanic/teichoic acid biosynthesis glycosyltransferase
MKRFLDILVSCALIGLLAPLFLAVGFAIWAKMGRPILFRQVRAGYMGVPFVLLKFRTMSDLHGDAGQLLPDSERIAPLGKFLRRFSLDELPQFWNVLRGDMSLVGPRPLSVAYLPRYSSEQARRHEMKPGITGWAQVNGRNAIDWEERFRLDVWYVSHWSLKLDARILWETMRKVLQGEGISQPGHITMPEFIGNDRRGL